MIMFADDGGFDREVESRPRTPEAAADFPPELLEGCRESVRRAQRLTKELGLSPGSLGSASRDDRLAWAIHAIEAEIQDPR